MRGNRVFVVLGLAAVLGLLASVMVWRVLHRPVPLQASERTSDLIEVVAAAVDLPVGTLVAEEQLTTVSLDGDDLPPGSFMDKHQVIGRGVIVPMVANEAVLESKRSEPGSGFESARVSPISGSMTFVTWSVDRLATLASTRSGRSSSGARSRRDSRSAVF